MTICLPDTEYQFHEERCPFCGTGRTYTTPVMWQGQTQMTCTCCGAKGPTLNGSVQYPRGDHITEAMKLWKTRAVLK